jgi:hypothetical protein
VNDAAILLNKLRTLDRNMREIRLQLEQVAIDEWKRMGNKHPCPGVEVTTSRPHYRTGQVKVAVRVTLS